MRSSPASFSARACRASVEPLVVSVSTAPSGASIATSLGRSLRTSGSPPVSRIFFTPRPVKTRATRTISSNVRIASCGRYG